MFPETGDNYSIYAVLILINSFIGWNIIPVVDIIVPVVYIETCIMVLNLITLLGRVGI